MEVIKAAVHYLAKAQHAAQQPAQIATQEIDVGQPSVGRLVSDVLDTFNSRCAHQTGVFETDTNVYPFSLELDRYLSGEQGFLESSVQAFSRLRLLVGALPTAVGGHVFFAHYRVHASEFILVVKLHTSKGSTFDESLTQVMPSTHLDISTLHVATRINISNWKNDDSPYMTFVSKREQGHASRYFVRFIGCNVQTDSRVDSGKLATVVAEFCKVHLDNGDIQVQEALELKSRVVHYVEERWKAHEPMLLEAVAGLIAPDDPSRFLVFLNHHPEKPSNNFTPFKGAFKKLITYVFVSDDLSLSMSHEFKDSHNVRVEGHAGSQRLVIDNPPQRLIEEIEI